jgi:hypothetical protein
MKANQIRQLLSALMIAQQFGHLGLLILERDGQRSLAAIILRVYSCPVIEQQFGQLYLAVAGGFVKGSASFFATKRN